MKTNSLISKDALENAYAYIVDVEHLTNEVFLTAINTRYLWEKLTENRRSKIHSIAFRALFEIVENNGGLPTDYYVSNPQMKKFLEERFGDTYQNLLADACRELEDYRKDHFNGK